jgi:hypothetical protein
MVRPQLMALISGGWKPGTHTCTERTQCVYMILIKISRKFDFCTDMFQSSLVCWRGPTRANAPEFSAKEVPIARWFQPIRLCSINAIYVIKTKTPNLEIKSPCVSMRQTSVLGLVRLLILCNTGEITTVGLSSYTERMNTVYFVLTSLCYFVLTSLFYVFVNSSLNTLLSEQNS